MSLLAVWIQPKVVLRCSLILLLGPGMLFPSAASGASPSLLGGAYSIGYKKLDIQPPYVWYWGWDYFNCNPETVLNTMGQPCMKDHPNPAPFLFGPFGGYLIGGRWIGNDGYPHPAGFTDYLDRAQGMRISPEDRGKPVWLTGPIFATSDGRSFVTPSVSIQCTPTYTANLPIWKAQTTPYLNWIEETARSIRNHPNLKFFTITHGIDGEGYFIRYADCEKALQEKLAADPTFPNPLDGVQEYVAALTDAYLRSFCDGNYDPIRKVCDVTMKPLFVQRNTWRDGAGVVGQYMPPLGIKFNAFTADTPASVFYKRYWRGWGTVEAFVRYRNLVPTSIEPHYGNCFLGGEQGTYWFGLQALWIRPTNIDVNPSYGVWGTAKEDPDYYDLIGSHLNVNAVTTPSVWIAFRDTDDLCGATTQEQYDNNICVTVGGEGSGIRGDYDFFLRRPDHLPFNKTVLLSRAGLNKSLYAQEVPTEAQTHKFAKYVRRTDKATGNYYMSFDVDNDYPWAGVPGQNFEVALSYLDIGTEDFFVQYKNGQGRLVQKGVRRENTRKRKTVRLILEDAFFNDHLGSSPDGSGEPTFTDFRLYNGGPGSSDIYLPMVKVKGLGQTVGPQGTHDHSLPDPESLRAHQRSPRDIGVPEGFPGNPASRKAYPLSSIPLLVYPSHQPCLYPSSGTGPRHYGYLRPPGAFFRKGHS